MFIMLQVFIPLFPFTEIYLNEIKKSTFGNNSEYLSVNVMVKWMGTVVDQTLCMAVQTPHKVYNAMKEIT